MLGVSDTRVYTYINSGRLNAVKASHIIMVPLEELENFKPNITGRPRKSTPPWRIPPTDNKLYITFIAVQVQPGQMDMLIKKLEQIKQSGKHTFPGTVARYITESEAFPGRVEIELVWRGATIRDETVREETLEAFRQELTDVLDWSTAQYSNSRMLLNT